MYENFERIPEDDKQRILQACIEEFAQHGYEHASTNAIVKRANIPKGTLFYFFSSKKDLYLYVIDYAVDRFVEFMGESAGEMPADLFERLLKRGQLRMQFVTQEPLIYQVFYYAFLYTPEEIKTEMGARYAEYGAASAQRLHDNLDRSKFRDDIDVEKAIELINAVLEGIFSRYLPVLKESQPDEILKIVDSIGEDVQGYFEMLKRGIYK